MEGLVFLPTNPRPRSPDAAAPSHALPTFWTCSLVAMFKGEWPFASLDPHEHVELQTEAVRRSVQKLHTFKINLLVESDDENR